MKDKLEQMVACLKYDDHEKAKEYLQSCIASTVKISDVNTRENSEKAELYAMVNAIRDNDDNAARQSLVNYINQKRKQ